MVIEVLKRAGISGFKLVLNSIGDANCRPAYVELLRNALRDVAPRMCGDCRRRAVTNPLRVLDCKVPEDQPIIETLPSIVVRGLDYYMRTTFEITHGALGAQNSVLDGGRYDGLAESLGSKVAAPGIGFSIGEDRLVMSVEGAHPGEYVPKVDVFLATRGDAADLHAGRAVRADFRRR